MNDIGNFIHNVRNATSRIFKGLKYSFDTAGQLSKIRKEYDVKGISDEELIEALNKANGNIDEAVILLFSK